MSANTRRCSFCGQDAQFIYTAKFRVGGTSGGAKLFLGEWAELGEEMVPMYVFVCPNCGKVELFATEELRQRAIELAKSRQP